jgi:hypothetical protein
MDFRRNHHCRFVEAIHGDPKAALRDAGGLRRERGWNEDLADFGIWSPCEECPLDWAVSL